MFSFMFVGMILLLLLLPGVAGIVLLIVGIARKKPALWGTGIGLMALAMLAVVVGGGYALFASATRLAPGPMAAPTVVARARAAVADEFSSYVGVGLPEAARVTASESRSYGGGKSVYLARLDVGPLFDRFLKENCRPATWDDVRAAMTEGSAAATDIWKPADLTGKAYYTRSFSGTDEADFTAEVCLAHDAEAGEARLISTKTAKE